MKFTNAVGKKFNEDGSARPFPGNTVICAVDPLTHVYKSLLGARDIFKQKLGNVGRYSFLPESSYHMTVFDCVCDKVRKPEAWTRDAPIDAPLAHVDAMLAERFAKVVPPKPFQMKYDKPIVADWLAVALSPASQDEEHRIRKYRDELSETFGIRQKGHETYRFHITLAYGIVEIEEGGRAVLEDAKHHVAEYLVRQFGAFSAANPYLAFFPDMLSFPSKR